MVPFFLLTSGLMAIQRTQLPLSVWSFASPADNRSSAGYYELRIYDSVLLLILKTKQKHNIISASYRKVQDGLQFRPLLINGKPFSCQQNPAKMFFLRDGRLKLALSKKSVIIFARRRSPFVS